LIAPFLKIEKIKFDISIHYLIDPLTPIRKLAHTIGMLKSVVWVEAIKNV